MYVTFVWHLQQYLIARSLQKQLANISAVLSVDGDAETFAEIASVADAVLPPHDRPSFLRCTAILFCSVHSSLTISSLNEAVQKQLRGDDEMAEIAKEWEWIESESEKIKSELIEEGLELNLDNLAKSLIIRLLPANIKLKTSEVVYYSDMLLSNWGVVDADED